MIKRLLSYGVPIILVAAIAQPAAAQYQVHTWTNFEDGFIPKSAQTLGPAENISSIELKSVTDVEPAFRAPMAASETANFALKLTAAPVASDIKSHKCAIAINERLERDNLGPTGKALYQADFYLPGPDKPLPSLAVMALRAESDPTAKTVRNPFNLGFYRFGLTLGSTLYFSYVQPGQKEAVVYVQDNKLLAQIPRPGWHRFAVVFDGLEQIRCYVDGRETSFSPIKEPTIRVLNVGVMLAENQRTYPAYADNLSIQFSTEASTLPQSPYDAN